MAGQKDHRIYLGNPYETTATNGRTTDETLPETPLVHGQVPLLMLQTQEARLMLTPPQRFAMVFALVRTRIGTQGGGCDDPEVSPCFPCSFAADPGRQRHQG